VSDDDVEYVYYVDPADVPELVLEVRPTLPPLDEEECRDLAAAVLRRAVLDAQDAAPHRRRAARAFLAGGRDLAWWCHVAGVDPDLIQEWVAARGAGGRGEVGEG